VKNFTAFFPAGQKQNLKELSMQQNVLQKFIGYKLESTNAYGLPSNNLDTYAEGGIILYSVLVEFRPWSL
jgi:hypothetical protein